MIHYVTPYRTDKDLGRAYNESFNICYESSVTHVCLMDGDVMFLTPNWGTIIEEYVALYPDAVLTCRTNRIHHLSKQLDNMQFGDDVNVVISEAISRCHLRTVTSILPGQGMSGFLMVIPIELWQRIPFDEGIGCLGVDSQFRIDVHNAGEKILIMDGLLVWHTYRLATGINDKTHLV